MKPLISFFKIVPVETDLGKSSKMRNKIVGAACVETKAYAVKAAFGFTHCFATPQDITDFSAQRQGDADGEQIVGVYIASPTDLTVNLIVSSSSRVRAILQIFKDLDEESQDIVVGIAQIIKRQAVHTRQ